VKEECHVCGELDEIKGSCFFGNNSRVCEHCYMAWYSDGMTDPKEIAEQSKMYRHGCTHSSGYSESRENGKRCVVCWGRVE
jgi:hypothetical protein